MKVDEFFFLVKVLVQAGIMDCTAVRSKRHANIVLIVKSFGLKLND